MENDDEFLPDIEAYLQALDNNVPVQISEFTEIIDIITAKTQLDQDAAKIVVRLLFQEIRNAMLNNEEINIRRFGKFFISSPHDGNKIRVFPKFKPHKFLTRKLNGK